MDGERRTTTLGTIFRFWLPMAGTWLMMALEAPFLAAVIARLDDPKENLAAFGVAYAIAILVESPVIMILSASTALVDDERSFRRLRRFTYALNATLTAGMTALLLSGGWRTTASMLIGLPAEVVELTQHALLALLPWPAAIGYRRFYQGLLIRNQQTRRVACGTVIRLGTMAGAALVLFAYSSLPGVLIAAFALSLGVCGEAAASRLMSVDAVRTHVRGGRDGGAELSYLGIWRFYAPLALTSTISLAVHPLVAFFIGRAPFPLESLAVLPVVNSLSFIFRSLGLSFQEVAIALLGRDRRNLDPVGRFAALLGAGSGLAMVSIAFTPLATAWFRDLSGLTPELTRFAVPPARILTLLPPLSVLLSLQRAILVHGRDTAPITWATMLEVAGIVLALTALAWGLGLTGVTAAALAFVAGRIAGNVYLVAPCRRLTRGP
ncbi:MAG TPA: hypothetical protein VD788_03140 [Candidatus Polarisedimenticolaceae bacterium]|nr:hypothetical protein [Candidatus Polarisedimenticolaceae bacterium]